MIEVMGLSDKGVARLEKAKVLKDSLKVDRATQKSVDQESQIGRSQDLPPISKTPVIKKQKAIFTERSDLAGYRKRWDKKINNRCNPITGENLLAEPSVEDSL